MRLVTYDAGAGPRVGLLDGAMVLDAGFDDDMVSFVAAGAPVGATRPVPDARLLAPLRPRSLRDFMTFEGHFRDSLTRLDLAVPDEWYRCCAYYKGMPDTVIGPDAEIPWPSFSDRIDHELELAAVIGRAGRDVPRERALEHVFGYTIWNDVSARDVQAVEWRVGMGPGKAKDWDGSNVLGPCIVTADEFDPAGARMEVRVNGERWGGDTSGAMHYSFADLIAYASRDQTIYPGEVIGSGTVNGGSGVELGRQLREGDLLELEVEGIGVLRNRIGRKER